MVNCLKLKVYRKENGLNIYCLYWIGKEIVEKVKKLFMFVNIINRNIYVVL